MTIEGLSFINACFEAIQLPYEFMEWTSANIPDTYFVGEYHEVEPMNEDGEEECSFILTGITIAKYLDLELWKETIKNYFGTSGKTAILESGSGIAVMYSDSYPIPSVDERIRRIQITLKIKEWRC